MALIVQKFGGSSVKDRDRIFNVARIVANTHNAGNDVVVVVSAQGDTTDDLIAKAAEITHNPSAREMDMLLAAGEEISIALLAMALNELGCHATSLTGWQAGFRTDRAYTKARITKLETERISSELERNRVVVVAGFQGLNKLDDITTLGRGGSDTSAVAIAAALHADRCQIFTDVEGVYTADPRKVRNTRKLDEITFDEMLELASLGAQVLNNRSVELAKKYNVELEVLSSLNPVPGTVVKEVVKDVEGMLIKGVAKDTDVAVITILNVPDEPGMSFKIFGLLAQKNINVDIILQSTGRDGKKDISFTCSEGEADLAMRVLKESAHFNDVSVDTTCAKVSIVGAGMQSHSGVASKMFEAMSNNNINIKMISTSEIKKAYRKLSRKYHPDIAGPEFEDKFKEVNNAYDVLSNPDKRRMYDSGVDPNNPNAGAGGFSGAGFGDMSDVFSTFFGSAFGGGSQGPVPRTQPGRDALASASIDLKTAVFGGTAHVKINTFSLCQECGGSGAQGGAQPVTCPDCHGQGFMQKVVRTMLGQMMTSAPCERCEGHGTIIQNPCPSCMGHGRVRTTRTVGVTVPAGINDNARLRLANQGEVGEGGGAAGDLYIDIRIKADKQFTRDGDDLHCWIQVPMSWAVLGHDLSIDTFDGEKTVSIPAGCQTEDTVTLKGLGVTNIRNKDERGNLIAHVNVLIPTKLNETERGLIEQFAASHDSGATHVSQASRPQAGQKKGFFSKLKDALS